MRKVAYAGLALMVWGLLAAPAWAQKGGHGGRGGRSTAGTSRSGTSSDRSVPSHPSMASQRSNKGGEVRGLERAKEVQAMNKRADANRGFTVAPGVEKAEARQATAKTAERGQGSSQRMQGKTQQGKGKGADNDRDESKD